MRLHDLPVAVLEVQHEGGPPQGALVSARRGDPRLEPAPSDASLPVTGRLLDQLERIPAAQLLHLLSEDQDGFLAVAPPLVRIGPVPLEPFLARDPVADRLGIAVTERLEEALDDAPDLL
jgi:hypothetical protein